ncbi:MAG: nucleotidyltransferase family protein [Anaerolineae bacterium]|nr:nucleotidyltransferase family protein [Anaerolineae bacterium]
MTPDMAALYRLMGLCAWVGAAEGYISDTRLAHIAEQAARVRDWSPAPTWAEEQGMAPLLCRALKAAGFEPPRDVWRLLQALALRHRLASRARTQVLREVAAAFATAGIPARFVKGAALAYLVYPGPELRPMRDVDLLVAPDDALRAQSLLGELGFQAPLPSGALPDRHLREGFRFVDGFRVTLEVHHNLFNPEDAPLSLQMEDLTRPPLAFSLPECALAAQILPMQTLDAETLLWHLCQHMRLSSGVFGANRLIWMADVVNVAERLVNDVDWDWLRAHHPVVLKTLSLLHFLIPLSGQLRARAGVAPGHAPAGIGEDFCGWPHTSLAEQRDKGWGGILRDTFFPPEWWLRLYYALGSDTPTLWARGARHPFHILGWTWHLFLERIGWYNARHSG